MMKFGSLTIALIEFNSNLNAAKLQLLLWLVGETTPGVDTKPFPFPPQEAQTA